ncbi:Transcriptional regulatory protein DegU [Streptomyces rubrolavendulae]|uniref:Transcriptional regulatory protein DegU n=1 Tax=Streptomyces rubrolavendulae TaxID=285473 RepID=A0A1D8G7S6_9ACTN|nr:Transcriptional regulatory protein DegU [Streptomyces rubrolavendulae]
MAEDRDVYREGLFVLLSEIANADVVGTAVDRKDLVHQSTRLMPDVVVAGTSLVLPDGLPMLSRLSEAVSGSTVMAAEHDTDELLRAALAAGVHGYVPLSSPREDFDAAIQAVAAGGGFLPARVTRRLVRNFRLVPRRTDRPAELELLSEREQQVLLLVGDGRSNREIARTLRVSEATVKSHVSRVLAKLELRDRVHAAQLVWRLGLDSPSLLPQT